MAACSVLWKSRAPDWPFFRLRAPNPPGNSTSAGGQHNQFELAVSHGWCDLDLSDPKTAGPWFFDSYTNYVTNDYLFEIPLSWAAAHAPGMRLASGRFRDGGWGGWGPTLFAFGPWLDGNPPEPGDTLQSILPLLMYGIPQPGMSELVVDDSMKMAGYKESDEWSGGVWLESGEKSAVVLVGTKGLGNCWYGFSDGTVWPENGPFPPVPPAPHDRRGWWSDSIQAQMIFYDPEDFGRVADKTARTWDPQPYAVLNLDPFLFDPGFDFPRYKRLSVGDIAFDRDGGFVYLMERRADNEKNLVHVWKVRDNGMLVPQNGPDAGFRLFQNFPNPFNGMTVFAFDLEKSTRVVFEIFNTNGTKVRTLLDDEFGTGRHRTAWDGKDDYGVQVSSGIYMYNIVVSGQQRAGKMSLIR